MDSSSQSQPFKPSASKLPIKRKSPHEPSLEYQPIILPSSDSFKSKSKSKSKPKPSPFKFQRIWSQPDEILFLQSLLQSHSLSFPRDLPLFYSSFSRSISHPYTKSQLSEKLRRLRKKFRLVSSRLARGLNPSSLSNHDRALFDLSKRLWSPDFASTSPFGKNNNNSDDYCDMIDNDNNNDEETINGETIDGVLGKSVLNVFDECFKEVRLMVMKQGVVCVDAIDKKLKEQRVSEFDVLGSRLRLVIENSLNRR